MNDNIYQTNQEPSGKDVWYASTISIIEDPNDPNTKMNRYANKLRLTTRTGVRMIEFIKKSQIYIEESPEDAYYYVDAAKRYRPDLISLEIYGTPVLYWVILSCNNLKHPLELKTGMTVRIPPLQSIIHDERVM